MLTLTDVRYNAPLSVRVSNPAGVVTSEAQLTVTYNPGMELYHRLAHDISRQPTPIDPDGGANWVAPGCLQETLYPREM